MTVTRRSIRFRVGVDRRRPASVSCAGHSRAGGAATVGRGGDAVLPSARQHHGDEVDEERCHVGETGHAVRWPGHA